MTTASKRPAKESAAAEPQLVKLVRKDSVEAEEWEAIRPTGRKALKSEASSSRPGGLKAKGRAPPRGLAENLAAHHASEYEFEPARREIGEWIKCSMSAAEAGVRLQSLLLRFPDPLAGQSGKVSSI